VEGLGPVVRSRVLNLADEEAPQIYMLSGRGARSALKIARHGLEVSELAVTELPGTPRAVWTLRRREQDTYDELIVISFLDATLALSVGEDIEEVRDSGLLATAPTLALHSVDGGGMVQVTPKAVRHVMPDGRVSEWLPPQGREIVCAAANSRQVVVALARTGGHCVYFELHAQRGMLREHEGALHVGSDVTCLALSPVAAGRLHAAFLAVGCEDQTVRLFALDASRCLEPLSMQAVAATPASVAVVHQLDALRLYTGLVNGLLVRASVDAVSGELDSTRTRFLGARAVQLCTVQVRGASAVVALSTAPWLCHAHQDRLRAIPLSYDALTHASGLVSEQCPEGLVCVAGNTLRILTIDRPDMVFNHASIPLALTPRDFVLNDESRHFVVIESDRGHMLPSQQLEQAGEPLPVEQFGLPRSARSDQWASLVRVLDPFTGDSPQVIELEDNFTAVSLAQVPLNGETYVAVGCARDLALAPRRCTEAAIRLYRWTQSGTQLELVHSTPVDGIPQCLLPFAGLLLVALGDSLRLYGLGIQRLLKKAQSAQIAPHLITQMQPHPQYPDQRLFVADVQESVRLVTYNPGSLSFHVAVDDTVPRYLTSMCVLSDGDTVALGDKFGNLGVVRVPANVAQSLDADMSGARLQYERPRFGKTHKWDTLCAYHIGDIPSTISACSLVIGARQVLLYTTLLGSVQVAVPFVSKGDLEFFRALEMAMRKLWKPVSGRVHLAFRSAIEPVKGVVDGDLCETFFKLDYDAREKISDLVDRTQQDIFKKLEDMRAMFAF
ncbi:pre-mRNA-splicing factor rse1, partial [Coemansia sp. RSA 2702]